MKFYFRLILTSLVFSSSNLFASDKNTKHVAIGPEYSAGWVHRQFFGSHWRESWTMPIDIPVLDLKTYGGGLTVTRQGGGMQTLGVRFQGKNGKEYKFRSINKDPRKGMPTDLADSLLADVLQDQVSVFNPAASLVVDPIANAIGVYQTRPTIVILPDDPALGEHRDTFKNVIGTIEENPTADEDGHGTFDGVDKINNTIKLYKRMADDSKEQVDAKAFLRARLLDIFIGDPDRHHKQWKWARVDNGEKRIWKPIARDRDQAFARYDGFFPWMATLIVRQLNGTSESYPSIQALTWSGRHLDRRFLNKISKAEWEQETNQVVSVLTDSLIMDAVKKLPSQIYAIEGATLEKVLLARRDKLKEASQEFYELLTEYVDIRGTEKNDLLIVNRIDSDRTRVSLFKISKKTGEAKEDPYFEREFHKNETEEIRIFLLGGDDETQYTGIKDNGIDLRIFPKGDNYLKSASTDQEKYEPDMDYGSETWFQPLFKASSDEGVLIGGGPIFYKHDVHQFPYSSKQQVRGGYAFGVSKFYFDYQGDFQSAIQPFALVIDAKASELEVQNFYGLGNNTVRDNSLEKTGFYKVSLQHYEFSPRIEFPRRGTIQTYLGSSIRYSSMNLDNTRLIGNTLPYGVDTNLIYSGNMGVKADTRDSKVFPTRGFYGFLNASFFPEGLENPNFFSSYQAETKFYSSWHLITDMTLSFKVGGNIVVGDHPFFESAFLGGSSTLRGYRKNRFGGDYSIYGGTELRLYLAKLKILFPARLGVFGFSDIGEVFLYREHSATDLHKTFGGGLWLSIINSNYTLVTTYARSNESTVVSLGIGSSL